MKCPICEYEPVAAKNDTCPQCDSDLSCLKRLADLETPPPPPAGPFFKIGIMISVVLLMVTALFLWIRLKNMEQDLLIREIGYQADKNRMLNEMRLAGREKERQASREIRLASETEPVPILPPAPKIKPAIKEEEKETPPDDSPSPPVPETRFAGKLFSYTAKDSDTLWHIARRFYGDGRLYPVLLELNPDTRIYDIRGGDTFRILDDPVKVGEIFHRIKTEGDGRHWFYTVKKGDTSTSIAAKFYPGPEMEDLVYHLNPGLLLEPGIRIRILLEPQIRIDESINGKEKKKKT